MTRRLTQKSGKSGKPGKSEKSGKSGKTEKSRKTRKTGKTEKSGKSRKTGKTEKSEKTCSLVASPSRVWRPPLFLGATGSLVFFESMALACVTSPRLSPSFEKALSKSGREFQKKKVTPFSWSIVKISLEVMPFLVNLVIKSWSRSSPTVGNTSKSQ